MPLNLKRLSKTVSYALRHAPEKFDLDLDAEGWTPVEALLGALRSRRREWRGLTEDDLVAMMAGATKQRFELHEGRIRAYYGHSMADRVQKDPVIPPELLYHGTSPDSVQSILDEGLKPMARQYVHLSTDEQTARMVGSRHAAQPVILTIRAGAAHKAGIAFYYGNEDVWLADPIPPEFITAP